MNHCDNYVDLWYTCIRPWKKSGAIRMRGIYTGAKSVGTDLLVEIATGLIIAIAPNSTQYPLEFAAKLVSLGC